MILFFKKVKYMGIGHCGWGLGIGDWAQSPIPNPQSPKSNTITTKKYYYFYHLIKNKKILK